MDEPICSEAAQRFYKNNFLVLQLNLVGHGKSEGTLKDLSYKTINDDITSAFNYLKQEYKPEKISGMGISLGAAAIGFSNLKFASQILLSYRVILDSKRLYDRYADLIAEKESELSKKGYIMIPSASGRGDFEMGEEWINEMRYHSDDLTKRYVANKRKTLLVQGLKDDFYDATIFNSFLKKSGVDYFEVITGNHNFSNKDNRDMILDLCEQWLADNLSM